MKKLLALLFLLPLIADAQTATLTCHVADLANGSITSRTKLHIDFAGCGGNPPVIPSGTSILGLNGQDFAPDGSGNVSTPILRNDYISCGGSTASDFYWLSIVRDGVTVSKAAHRITTSTYDCTHTPITTNPVVAAPTGDTTYLRIDGTNGPVTGALTFTAPTTFNGATGLAGAVTASGGITSTGADSFTNARFKGNPWFDVKANGAVGDGVTDDTAAFQTTCNNVNQAGLLARAMFIPAGTYKLTVPSGGVMCDFTQRGVAINGTGKEVTGGSVLNANFNTSTGGVLFQWGADDGQPWDTGSTLYQGIQGANISNLYINCNSASTALLNGQGNYCAKAYAIKDWRGGSQVLTNVVLARFDYGFWGINSDFDIFQNVAPMYNHTAGIYLGPRSDQANLQVNTLFNDTALRCERCWGLNSFGSHWVGDGSATTYPIEIHEFAVDHSISKSEKFDHDWFEHFQGAGTIPGFINFGIGDTGQSLGLELDNPLYMGNDTSGVGQFHAKALVAIGNADSVLVTNPHYYDAAALDYIFDFWGSTSPQSVSVRRGAMFNGTTLANYANSTGTPLVSDVEGNGTVLITDPSKFQQLQLKDARYLNGGVVNIALFSDSSTGGAHYKVSPITPDHTGATSIEFFRNTQTSGAATIIGDKGDGTGTQTWGIDSVLGKATFNGGAVIGSAGTALLKWARYSATLTPSSVAANTCAAQSFTVTGVVAGDFLMGINKPTEQAGLSVTPGHVTGSNTATVNFCNSTASPITPTASEAYQFVVVQ